MNVATRPHMLAGISEEEWQIRCDLAALYRLVAHHRWTDFVYTHHWAVGDLVMWDNRCTMHKRDPFDPSARRVLHRTQIKGEARPAA